MINAIWLLAGAIRRLFDTHRRLLLENLALRQQLAVLKRRHPRPRLAAFDKLFWVLVRRFWSGWQQALIIVSPETVVCCPYNSCRTLRHTLQPFWARQCLHAHSQSPSL